MNILTQATEIWEQKEEWYNSLIMSPGKWVLITAISDLWSLFQQEQINN